MSFKKFKSKIAFLDILQTVEHTPYYSNTLSISDSLQNVLSSFGFNKVDDKTFIIIENDLYIKVILGRLPRENVYSYIKEKYYYDKNTINQLKLHRVDNIPAYIKYNYKGEKSVVKFAQNKPYDCNIHSPISIDYKTFSTTTHYQKKPFHIFRINQNQHTKTEYFYYINNQIISLNLMAPYINNIEQLDRDNLINLHLILTPEEFLYIHSLIQINSI